MKKNTKAALCAVLAAAVLTAAIPTIRVRVLADTHITGGEALEEAVALYQDLTDAEVEIPDGAPAEIGDTLVKSVLLGYVNLDEAKDAWDEDTVRKQDYITILYKAVISSDAAFALHEDEANAILNECYDNAYISEANRTAYAFMMKQGIIDVKSGSEPEKTLTREECDNLTDAVRAAFSKDVSINIGNNTITVGANVQTVIDALGNPNRIDETEYGFDWYVYNATYADFCMVGVTADRICAVFTNSASFNVGGVKAGDDYSKTDAYSDDRAYRFYMDSTGRVDSVLYNPAYRGLNDTASIKRSKALLLIDMINANRAKNTKPLYAEDAALTAQAWLSTFQDGEYDAFTQSGYDVFSIYRQMVEDDADIITQTALTVSPIGVSVSTDDDGTTHASFITDTARAAQLPKTETVGVPDADYSIEEINDVTTPIFVDPQTSYEEGDDVVLTLALRASNEYHVEIFDVESDDYAVNQYLVTDSAVLTFPSELFKSGRDYNICISSITADGEALDAEPLLISCGAEENKDIRILTPYDKGVTDDDYIYVSWESDNYHDFCVDIYNENDELIIHSIVEDEYSAGIHGIEPGEYFLYITALRRGTKEHKAQASARFEVTAAQPVIDEFILDKNDKYYFVYEDKELGLLYFYDEELIDVEENGKTVQKKKIIRKQVKATDGYVQLAKYRLKPEYTTGDPVISTGSGEKGARIVNEAIKYLGVNYVWGGTTPEGFDCSGLVQYVCNAVGINVNRVAEDQFKNGTPVNRDELQPGDLVFFERNGYIHHVGIYVGNGMMIHAPRTGDVVRYQSIDTDYYRSEYAGARRVG